ncbi:zf-HC2 domain-containing protein [Streptomyces sp. NRRL_ISP-5395]|uniref:zf-HC2 domain-containing protein n=1 Tax=Streptomyces TaxID=1883 RepID=UPI0004C8F206|nr:MULTISPECIES: zf-HC2 domain-containing protein [Streptomyces]MDX2670750.1 zf-HC2 domain-containing protein [Streptomyces sp. NRRL_ISP-5395]GHF67059.1 membrane protein [Streptomyces griseus]
MSVEHPSDRLVSSYAHGDTDLPADALWAVEAHLEQCAPCRRRLAGAAAEVPAVTALLTAVRSGLEPALDRSTPAPLRRRRPTAWATPVMGPWLAMVIGVSVVAVLLDRTAGWTGGAPPVLLLAPVLPLAGVAAAWSRGLDPAFELTAVTPRAGLSLLLRRTATVLAVVLPVHLVAGLLTGVALAQWLLPSLALTATALALGGVIGVGRATVALGALWTVAVLAPAAALGRLFLLRPEHLPLWALALAAAVGVVLARRRSYTTPKSL